MASYQSRLSPRVASAAPASGFVQTPQCLAHARQLARRIPAPSVRSRSLVRYQFSRTLPSTCARTHRRAIIPSSAAGDNCELTDEVIGGPPASSSFIFGSRRWSTALTGVDGRRHLFGATGMSTVAGDFCEIARVVTIGTAVLFTLRSRAIASGMGALFAHESSF
jgi:hypothetical protein